MALADPSGASVQAVAANTEGDVLYAVLTGSLKLTGLYLGEDNGYTWQMASAGLGAGINALAVYPADDSLLHASTGGGSAETADNLWSSDNGGQTRHKFTFRFAKKVGTGCVNYYYLYRGGKP